jgi:phospholipase A-2-activating protein
MNVPAAKSKIATLNGDLKLLSVDDEAILDQVYTFLGGRGTDVEGTGGESANGLTSIISAWPEAQRFPRKP